jgi:acetyl esterase/lipase
MRSDYNERKQNSGPGNRVMLYVHGGAYFFGSVGEHRYQMQRHARKLKARVFAPRYRLAPQFPFPCGLQDCLAAYLYLLTVQSANTIILAGDSAGGGMVVSMLAILRDRGIALPAGAVLISPWVDLTHSFPSVARECPFDYIPQAGFHHKPSASWPPPNEDESELLKTSVLEEKEKKKDKATSADERNPVLTISDFASTAVGLSVNIDGRLVEVKEQIQVSKS